MGLFVTHCSHRTHKKFMANCSQSPRNETISDNYNMLKTNVSSVIQENIVMRINFRKKPAIDVLRMHRKRDGDEYLHVQFCIFNKKSIKTKSIRFLEWMLVNDLKHFFEMEHKDILRNIVTIEYGYFQGDEEILGSFKEFNDDEFTEDMTFIILEYARYMLDIHD